VQDDVGPSWPDLLQSVASGQQRLVLETSDGGRVVLVAESEFDGLVAASNTGARRSPVLTGREREVLELVAEGLTGAVIAERLGVATNTVAQHLIAVRRKFGVRSSAAAVLAAREAGELD